METSLRAKWATLCKESFTLLYFTLIVDLYCALLFKGRYWYNCNKGFITKYLLLYYDYDYDYDYYYYYYYYYYYATTGQWKISPLHVLVGKLLRLITL